MDALSQTLRVVRLVGAIFINARFTAPWCYQSPSADTAAPFLEPDAERVVIFHLITEGECYVELGDDPPLLLNGRRRGDVPPRRRPSHVLRTGLDAGQRRAAGCGPGAAAPAVELWRWRRGHAPGVRLSGVRHAVGGHVADGVAARGAGQCARLERRYLAGIFGALCPGRSPLAQAGRRRRAGETGRGVVHRSTAPVHARTGRGPNRLAGRRERPDRRRRPQRLHNKPCHAWTLEELARTAGTSRSVLAERFQQLVGVSPMQYLTQWRMLLAANLLRSSNSSLMRIAEEVGYQTDTAFSRAFRREFGAPPAAWRRSQENINGSRGEPLIL